ncbi:MAG TPA: radical SAM protein [Candidatus Deferrimicrobium sp.]|nr:radical SAM protein [Candidatus Deferrimicrobium sp.]
MSDITIANLFYNNGNHKTKTGHIPIGPLYIASSLEKEYFEVDFRDYITDSSAYPDPMNPRSVFSFLSDSARIVGVSCACELLPLAILALRKLKNAYPEKKIILGGIGPTNVAQDILVQFPFIDIIVRGEGERTSVALMKRLTSGECLGDVNGITFRQGDRIISNDPRERIKKLDAIPFPAYDKINIHRYANVGIYSSRGCPFRCRFCDVAPFWDRVNYRRTIDNIIDEIELLKDTYNREEIDIMDQIFVLDRAKVLEFCRRVKQRKVDFQWSCSGRIDLIDEELMDEMAIAGCRMIFYNIASGSNMILKKIFKGFTAEQARDILVKSRKYFNVAVALMWGFPFETMEDFWETLAFKNFAIEHGCRVDLYLLAPLPLSMLYREYGNHLEFFAEKLHDIAAAGGNEIEEFARQYPTVSHWFYRYRTGNFQKKYEIIGHH